MPGYARVYVVLIVNGALHGTADSRASDSRDKSVCKAEVKGAIVGETTVVQSISGEIAPDVNANSYVRV